MATCSLECPSPNCTLGEDGARFKTPELDAALAMQLLMLHDERNHKQPVQMVEAGNSFCDQKRFQKLLEGLVDIVQYRNGIHTLK